MSAVGRPRAPRSIRSLGGSTDIRVSGPPHLSALGQPGRTGASRSPRTTLLKQVLGPPGPAQSARLAQARCPAWPPTGRSAPISSPARAGQARLARNPR
ncbi:hypothetical protein NDU88_004885 [Pleurodeles waltl]|uniref:Uncharacterized protein n=1 Tax=Pleurodeles waltl TaxID=8319 RepID=A0AAV7LSA8_PLEWA|nr:hypothetical protein NDU88_004885 [Pleurodeles waltl]